MRKLLLLSLLFSFTACNLEAGYTIKGTLTGDESVIKSSEVYLANRDRENVIRDTAQLVNGKFSFKGNVVNPETYYITIKGVKGRVAFFLENDSYTLTADAGELNEAVVKGGTTQELYNQLHYMNDKIYGEFEDAEALIKEYRDKATTAERKKEISDMFDAAQEKLDAFEDSLVAANPFTYFSLNNFQSKVNDMDVKEAEARLNEFKAKAEFEGNKVLKQIEENINSLKGLQNGMLAPEFSLPNPDGKEISLSSVYKKNKITMIDFWAGWCNPCRQFNPTLVKIYNKYHKKGFEVLGVSLDRERESWLRAIKDDKLPWIQVSDLKYWECAPARLYAVRYIPQNAFVDQNGNIIARKLSEEEIVELLEEHLK